MTTNSVKGRRVRAAIPAALGKLKEDQLALGLLAGSLLLMVALLIWLGSIYSDLPDLLPLHFDAAGNPDRIAERQEIFMLPAIGLAVNLVNVVGGLVARFRYGMIFASYLLWGGGFMVQILLWIAAWNILH